jgi:hypothetical protein
MSIDSSRARRRRDCTSFSRAARACAVAAAAAATTDGRRSYSQRAALSNATDEVDSAYADAVAEAKDEACAEADADAAMSRPALEASSVCACSEALRSAMRGAP